MTETTSRHPVSEPPGGARILMISPVRNEAAQIEQVVRAVAAQETVPARWIVIDDGSTDGTVEIVRRLSAEVPFLELRNAPRDRSRAGSRDRLALAVEARNFNLAAEDADWRRYTHVMKLDGDIELPPEYLRVLMERFDADPELGLAAGVLVEPVEGGGLRPVRIPRNHVHGALKCYTRACFEAIGGVQERLGWDTIDETYARMRGLHTVSYTDLVATHHRPCASADGILRGRARHGECAYINHYPLSWVVLRAAKVGMTRPAVLSGGAFLFGYLRASARRVPRVADAEFRRFTHRELRRRMIHLDLSGRSLIS